MPVRKCSVLQVTQPVPIKLVMVGADTQVTPGNCLSEFRSNTFLNYHTHKEKIKNIRTAMQNHDFTS